MSSIQELRQEAYKVTNETQQGGNSASRIGNLYNGIIDFLGVLDDRTVDPYYYDDTALKEAIRRVDAAIADLDAALDAAIALANQERQRLDDLVNSIDGEIAEKVDDMLNDAAWLETHAKGIQELVNEGEILWRSEWDQNIEQYLQEVGVWAREGDVIKTQWTAITQDVASIQTTVAEVQQDLAGRPTSTQWSQITQKVNGIEQTVNALLYQGDVTEALQSSINQFIDNKVASLNLDTTYAKIDTENSKEIIEWLYSALRNETTSEKTYNDIVSAGKSGMLNGISNVHTYVEVVRNGEVLDYVAGSAIESKVNDSITGLYNKASAGDAQTTIFSQVKKDTQDIATIATHATNDYSAADIATKFDNFRSGIVMKSELDGSMAALLAAGDESRSGVVVTSKIDEATTDILSQVGGMTSGFLLKSNLGEAMAQMVASDQDGGTTAAIVAKVNRSGSEIMLSADQVTMTDAFANSITANRAFIGYLEGGSATFSGDIIAKSLRLGTSVSIPQGNVTGLTNDLAGKASQSDLNNVAASIPTSVTDLAGSANILYTNNVIVNEETTSKGLTKRRIQIGSKEFTEIEGGDFVLTNIGIGVGKDDPTNPEKNLVLIEKNGLLTAHNAVIYGDIYANNGYFSGELKSVSGKIAGFNINDVYLGTNPSGYGAALFSDGGIYSYPNPSSSTYEWALNVFGKSQIMMKVGNGMTPALSLGLDQTSYCHGLNIYPDSSNNIYVKLGGNVAGAINSCNVQISGNTIKYSYDGTNWFDFGRKPARTSVSGSITLKGVDETLFISGDTTIPNGSYTGQHLTIIATANNKKIKGHFKGISNKEFTITDAYQVWDLYWTGSTWAIGFQNVPS